MLKLLLVLALIAQACSPVPRRALTADEKTADLYWVFSKFEQNYAPLEYKEKLHGFDYQAKKEKYLADARATTDNESFYRLMHQFVAEFKDAHTSSSLMSASLPGRARIAYLGFDGVRKGETFVVKELLPTFTEDSKYPIEVGDVLVKLDGVALKDIVLNEMVLTRNLGQVEANLTYLMPKIFNRTSISASMPTKANAVLTVKSEDKEGKEVFKDITVPWIVKDLITFTEEQDRALQKKDSKDDGTEKKETLFGLIKQALNGRLELIPAQFRNLGKQNRASYRFWNSFVFVDNSPTWASRLLKDAARRVLDPKADWLKELKKVRSIPENAIWLTGAAPVFPTYLTAEPMKDKEDKPTGEKRMVATMILDTFSPAADEEDVIKEVKSTLKRLAEIGVKDIVIDTIDNGGGSLSLGMAIAQLLSPTKVVQPEIQFRTSDSWIDEFEMSSLSGASDAEREISRRVFESLVASAKNGDQLSQRMSTEELFPFQFKGNEDLDARFNIVVLINEMCASMCDIFAATLKDNEMATLVGTQTMGAGGNVVQHGVAPNSGLMINQTESLILRKDGTYIENNGVKPDIEVKVNEAASSKYASVHAKAIEWLVKAR